MTKHIRLVKFMEAGAEEMERMPIGHTMTVITKGNPVQGEYYVKVYKKVQSLHVKVIEEGWRS